MARVIECAKCGEPYWTGEGHECLAKEPLDGSPLESVVQGRAESPVPLNPAVQGTPCFKMANKIIVRAIRDAKEAKCVNRKHGYKVEAAYWAGMQVGIRRGASIMRQAIVKQDNTAPDTTSGSAGVP